MSETLSHGCSHTDTADLCRILRDYVPFYIKNSIHLQDGRVQHHQAPPDDRVGDEEDRGQQHAGLHLQHQGEQAPDQGRGQEVVRYQRLQGQHSHQAS